MGQSCVCHLLSRDMPFAQAFRESRLDLIVETFLFRRQDELLRNRCPAKTVDVWRKGVDTNMFHPRHRCAAMRERLSGGHPAAPILVYVGRLGAGAVLRNCHLAEATILACGRA